MCQTLRDAEPCTTEAPLARARRAAERSGVTRLADVTGLDRLGVPVFQAIRPWSRALSVHQGKGLDAEAAQIGALMQAIESEHAESFGAAGVVCGFEELAPAERAARLSDFALERRRAPGERTPVRWVEARTLLDHRPLWVPFDVVSLDFTRAASSPFERSSSGLAAHFCWDGAVQAALLEALERDAVGRWMGQGLIGRLRTGIDPDSVPYPWFQRLHGRLSVAGVRLAVFLTEAVIGAPVVVCELIEPEASAIGRGAVFGSACRVLAEDALMDALLEAIQRRLAEISGVRDDIGLPQDGPLDPAEFGAGLPAEAGARPRSWTVDSSLAKWRATAGPHALARRLADAGYGQAAVVDLSRPDEDVVVVKAVAPGLGSHLRSRRPAAAAP
jgi:ribosomal protein S12 methylthiotransferase accessory factor